MMTEKDYAPLSAACVRSLNDKMYEKRKAAAVEIEKLVKDAVCQNKPEQIKRVLKVLGQDFATSQNPHTRKGGLIGLAAVAVALGKDTSLYIRDLTLPILACFCDSDARVRYHACESLYNVVKVARRSILVHFRDIFNSLSVLAADPDQQMKTGAELLDRLMKDIVTESATSFDLVTFMPILREKIYTENSFSRQFIVSWVSVLDADPNIDLIPFLPEILDGLFRYLEDPTPEIKKMCDTALGEFLRSIKKDPSRVDFAGMINMLIIHAQATDELLQATAITWIKEFVQLSGRTMLPFASGILLAVLPCISYSDTDSRRNIKETAKAVNFSLMKLINERDNEELSTSTISDSETTESSGTLSPELDLPSVVTVLIKQLSHTSVDTKVAVLCWISDLYSKIPDRMFRHVDELFPVLLRVLTDISDTVVYQDLEVLAEIMKSPTGKQFAATGDSIAQLKNLKLSHGNEKNDLPGNPFFTKFLINLLKLFCTDRHLLEDRGSFIIRRLCVLLNSEDIYRTFSEILQHEDNLKFASIMVETLNTILLTSPELFELRIKLKDLQTEESCSLFVCLYESWCHNPVATVALCLLTHNYGHANDLIRNFGNLEVTVEFLTEIDKLVQLIESPIFIFLRLELLEVPHNQHLVQALYGLLMLLPQTDAFHLLRKRLQCIPGLHLPCSLGSSQPKQVNAIKHETLIDFKKLLQHFISVQDRHNQSKHLARTLHVLERRALGE